MSTDYRIGLIAGSVLAGAALVWVATRPSLGPRLPSIADSNHNAPATAPAGRRPTDDRGQTADKGTPDLSVLRRPSSVVLNPPSVASEPPVATKTEPNQTPRIHVVRPGETLSTIAQQYYGSASSWRKIATANPNTVKDGNKIAPGMKLTIPQ